MTDKKSLDNNEELTSKMNKQTSRPRAVGRIILGFFAFMLWFFLGVPPTLIYSSGVQTFIGTFTFFSRNPIIFLLVAILNVFMGIFSYFFVGILWYSAFHLLWSIRWFYGYNKYRGLKNH
jgi:uncharacterized membrane-anchored protein YitT (DUF2179 family)